MRIWGYWATFGWALLAFIVGQFGALGLVLWLRADDLVGPRWTAEDAPTCYVCGPTGFVEAAADLLVGLGHAPDRVRTERFGPSGP